MPEYDFTCRTCQSDFSLQYKSFSAYSSALNHLCPYCNSDHTARKIGRVALAKGGSSRLDELASSTNIDENDPKAIESFYNRLSQELDLDISENS